MSDVVVVIQVKVVLKSKLIVTKSLSVYMMTSQGRLYVTDGLHRMNV